MNGWIKLHRRLVDWEWYQDSKTLHLWIHILMKANHTPKQWQGKTIESGQFVTGRHQLSAETGISQQSIRTILKRLISTSNITIQSTNKFSIISVCNWESYQITLDDINQQDNQQANQHSTSNQPTTNQQLTTTKNDKKEKKERKCDVHKVAVAGVSFPEVFTESLKKMFLEFAETRYENGKYLTERAIKAHFKQLDGFSAVEIAKAYNEAIANGWQSIHPKRMNGNKSPVQNATRFPDESVYKQQSHVKQDEKGNDILPF